MKSGWKSPSIVADEFIYKLVYSLESILKDTCEKEPDFAHDRQSVVTVVTTQRRTLLLFLWSSNWYHKVMYYRLVVVVVVVQQLYNITTVNLIMHYTSG